MIFAAASRSSSRPFVQEPMTIWWTFIPGTSAIGLTLSTVCGQAICGSSAETSISIDPLVDGVGVGDDRLDRVGHARLLAQVADRLLVGRDDARRGARLDRHVAERRGGPRSTSSAIVSPWNSRTLKFAPSAVSLPMRWRIRSFGPTCGGNSPVHLDLDRRRAPRR